MNSLGLSLFSAWMACCVVACGSSHNAHDVTFGAGAANANAGATSDNPPVGGGASGALGGGATSPGTWCSTRTGRASTRSARGHKMRSWSWTARRGPRARLENPDGSLVAVLFNSTAQAAATTVALGSTTVQVQVPSLGWATLYSKG